eukprot:scaffold3228_cov384-Prasinococcus_capsulatus_cf.AAC.5
MPTTCEAQALKRCLEENDGDHQKCRAQLKAFMQCANHTSGNTEEGDNRTDASPTSSRARVSWDQGHKR